MPPKTRGDKVTKKSKENIDANAKIKLKTRSKVSKPSRAALADKTNSASDDNATFVPSKDKKQVNVNAQENFLIKQRPRRERRVPTRYAESNILQNLSNSKIANNESVQPRITSVKKKPFVVLTPLKTPMRTLDNSLAVKRPKRICRLPSKFDNHSISPSKFVPAHPAYASTPKNQSKPIKMNDKKDHKKMVSPHKTPVSEKVISSKIKRTAQLKKKASTQNKSLDKVTSNSPDTNNNAKKDLLPRNKTKNIQNRSPEVSVKTIMTPTKKVANKNRSFRVLDDNKNSLKRDISNIDIYEFTYDPSEEPPPQKRKRKRPTKKREPRPKMFVFKNNYERNMTKALMALKKTVTSKTTKVNEKADTVKAQGPQVRVINPTSHFQASHSIPQVNTHPDITPAPSKEPMAHNPIKNVISAKTCKSMCNAVKSNTSEKNYQSVRVEDIELDFGEDNVDNINYSPMNSPNRPVSPPPQNNTQNVASAQIDDPLNLRDDFSFFDEQPVASSSMNISVRHPSASPWRVEFGSLPIKWQVNTYVKPNMTPAFESSFLNFNENKKKHVYTNLGSETNEAHDLPQIFEENPSKFKQTSIMSFIKEVVEKNAKKRKEKLTPIKNNSLFEDLHATSICDNAQTPQKQVTPDRNDHNKINNVDNTPANPDISSDLSKDNSGSDKNNSKDDKQETLNKRGKRRIDKNLTYFGFDDSENHDQENVSPVKKIDKRKLRALKPRSRAVLQEINEQKGPTRAALPVAIRSKPIQGTETANELFDQIKSATEPPIFPDKEAVKNKETVNSTEVQTNNNMHYGDSVHLFEDLEFVHHLKAHRKSYGKAKKAVTFRQNSISDSDVPASDVAEQSASSDEDDRLDLTFKVPAALEPKKAVKKKKSKKQKLSKKERQEVETWAAGFNSMCEDIEEFDLVVE